MDSLSQRLIEEGSITLGIALAEALLTNKGLPQQRAQRHLRLSCLLTTYTRNIGRAREHVNEAGSLVAHRRDAFDLRCHIVYQLGYCHGLLTDHRSRTECYQKGMEMCLKPICPLSHQSVPLSICWDEDVGDSREERDTWYCRFAVSWLQTTGLASDAEMMEVVHRVQSLAMELSLFEYQMWIPMTLGYKALCFGDLKEAERQISDFESILEKQKQAMDTQMWQMAFLYCVLLRSTLALQSGDVALFSIDVSDWPKNERNGVTLSTMMMETLTILDVTPSLQDPFGWLQRPELEMALLSNFATVLLVKGHLQASLEMTARLRSRLPHLKTQEDIQLSELSIGSVYISMETSARIHLLMGHLTEAQDETADIIEFMDRQHQQKHKMRGPLHRLIGCYLQTVGMQKLSTAHFRKAMEVSSDDMPLITALAEVIGNARGSFARASDLLKPSKDDHDDPLRLYVSALLNRHQGEGCASRACLVTALEETKPDSLPMELKCQLHLASGDMYLEEGNSGAALEMYESAHALSRKCQNPMLTFTSIQGLRQVYKLRTDVMTEKQLEEEASLLQKQTQSSLKAALGRDIHRSILRWDLTSQKQT